MAKLPSVGILALISILFSATSQAATTTYTAESAFLAALPGPASTLDFDSLAAGVLIPSGNAVGGITFNYDFGGVSMTVTDGNQFGGGGPFDTTSGSNFLGTNDADIFLDDDDFSMTFAPVSAIGMFFITAEEPGLTIFDDDIQLSVGSTTALLDVDAVQQTLGDGALVYFLGLIDDSAAFNAASLSTPNSSGSFLYNIDDITTAVVPLPGALWLFGSGLVGLLSLRRKC